MDRNKLLINCRPQIPNLNVDVEGSEIVKFQNSVLRQIIKFQHELLISIFDRYLHLRKLDFSSKDSEQQKRIIEQLFLKDRDLKSSMEGVIIGHFTADEYDFFCKNETDLRKRIRDIIKKRIWDSIDQLSI